MHTWPLYLIFLLGFAAHVIGKGWASVTSKSNSLHGFAGFYEWFTINAGIIFWRFFTCGALFQVWMDAPYLFGKFVNIAGFENGLPLTKGTVGLFAIAADSLLDKIFTLFGARKDIPEIAPPE